MLELIAGPLAKLAGELIDNLFETEEEKAAAKARLMTLEQQGKLAELEVSISAILAEARSRDPWTSRARPTFLFIDGQPVHRSGAVAQVKYAQSTASTDVTTTILHDNSVPQNNEGEEIVAVSITPTNASSTLIIEWGVHGSLSGNRSYQTAAIFVGTTANAIAAVAREADSNKFEEVLVGSHGLSAGGTAARTYKLRTGPSAGTFHVNQGINSGPLFSTAGPASWIKVTEILP